MNYPAGTQVLIRAQFFDVDGDPADPTGITVEVQPGPGRASTTYVYATSGTGGWTRLGTGDYRVQIDTTGCEGQFTCQWKATGAVQATGVWVFDVTALPLVS